MQEYYQSQIYDILEQQKSPQKQIHKLQEQIKNNLYTIEILKAEIHELKTKIIQSSNDFQKVSKDALSNIVVFLRQEKQIEELKEQIKEYEDQRRADVRKNEEGKNLDEKKEVEIVEVQDVAMEYKNKSDIPEIINYTCCTQQLENSTQPHHRQYSRNGINFDQQDLADFLTFSRQKTQLPIQQQIQAYLINFVISTSKTYKTQIKQKQLKFSLEQEKVRLISVVDNFNFDFMGSQAMIKDQK